MSREIDVRIHEEFFDAKITRVMGNDFIELENVPHYSTDIKAAWEVVEKFEKWALFYWSEGVIRCTLDMKSDAEASTAPMAICLAALKAREIEALDE